MNDTDKRLIEFAKATLRILSQQDDWDAGTLDDISAEAYSRYLADTNDEGLFTFAPGLDLGFGKVE